MATELLERPTLVETDTGEPGMFAHYVDKDEATKAYVMGTPIRALCGKVWVPSRDPERFPMCPECQEIYEAIVDAAKAGAA